MELEEELQALEERLLQPSVRSDKNAVADMLAEDFCEFGSSGRIFTKQEIIRNLHSEMGVQLSLKDFRVVTLSDEVAIVTYRTLKQELGSAAVESLRSSTWSRRDGRWQMLFHQGTRIPAL